MFAYILVLLKRLPDQKDKEELIIDISSVVEQFRDNIELMSIGFPENYLDILNNNK